MTLFIAPAFAQYDKDLARAMTAWLYNDISSPTHGKPELWSNGPRVQFVQRNLEFSTLATGVAQESNDLLFGGKNAILFGRSATAKETTPSIVARQLNNSIASNVEYQQRIIGGSIEILQAPVSGLFGAIPGQPWTYPAPFFWYGQHFRKFTVVSSWTNDTVDLTLTFMAAVLDTGR